MKIDLALFERLFREGHEGISRDELVHNLGLVERLLRDGDEAAAEIGLSRAERRQTVRVAGQMSFATIAIAERQQAMQAIGVTGIALFRSHLEAAFGRKSYDPLDSVGADGSLFRPLLARADEFAQIVAAHKAKEALRPDVHQDPIGNGGRP